MEAKLAARAFTARARLEAAPFKTRKEITIANDDGKIRWNELSLKEKAARTTQQTFNLGIVLTGVVLTVCHIPSSICFYKYMHISNQDMRLAIERSDIPSLYGSLLLGQQDETLQPCGRSAEARSPSDGNARSWQADQGVWRADLEQVGEGKAHCFNPSKGTRWY